MRAKQGLPPLGIAPKESLRRSMNDVVMLHPNLVLCTPTNYATVSSVSFYLTTAIIDRRLFAFNACDLPVSDIPFITDPKIASSEI